MGKMQTDWRHYTVAVVVLGLLIALCWKVTLGSPPAKPTAQTPAGKQPIAASPDSP